MQIDPVSRIRRFNRAVTTEVGALDTSFLGRGRPLGAARVLNAIGKGCSDVAQIRAMLELDSGLMSRLLRALETEGLIETVAHTGDARRRVVVLTEAGASEFAEYEALSDAQAAAMLERHPKRDALLAAMDLIASALGQDRIEISETDADDRAALYCLDRYYAEMNARFAGGFDVARSRNPERRHLTRPRGAVLVARSDGLPLGVVCLRGEGREDAEIKRLWVDPSARNLGLAQRLMAEAEEIARGLSIRILRLDTNSQATPEAVVFYRKLGWREIDRFNDDPYPDTFFEKTI